MRRTTRTGLVLVLAVLAALLAGTATAHDIPNDVLVLAFVKPEGARLRVLVRVPLRALRDVQFPARDRVYVDLARVEPVLRDAATLWLGDELEAREGDRPLGPAQLVAVMPSRSFDDSFGTWDTALAHVLGQKPPDDPPFVWNEGLLDALFEFPITSDRSDFSIAPNFGRLGVKVVTGLRFLPASGPERALQLPGSPGLVRLDPRWWQAARTFVQLGFEHILDGTDHLLFVLCLVIPFRRVRGLVPVVTAFTVAHSVTLVASAYGLAPSALWFPPLIETLIALSILFMAIENIVATNLARRWLIAFGFGLVHGFGFSFALRESLQLAGTHLLASLLAFNVGVELGQVAVLVVAVPVLALVFRRLVDERPGTIILSVIVAHTAWHWMVDRYATLREFRMSGPGVDALLVLSLVRWAFILVAAAGLTWAGVAWWNRLGRPAGTPRSDDSAAERRQQRRPV